MLNIRNKKAEVKEILSKGTGMTLLSFSAAFLIL
jgi:hypothetical protein